MHLPTLTLSALLATITLGALVTAPNLVDEQDRTGKRHTLQPNALDSSSSISTIISFASLIPSSNPSATSTPHPKIPPGTLIPDGASCDPACSCATGGKPIPTDGRVLYGFCDAVSAAPSAFVNITDVVLCKDNVCFIYDRLDGRCEGAMFDVVGGGEWQRRMPDYAVWCP
ncbi:hypothetical protein K458DRAFT_406182 [Lentithecium fluviatile CBS 122367]|uniref:Uncharacterized protein n=1 Tax=Lentithecium fluviatile CBS 122367 TaxID=1168545 RepID=A0A6G1IUR0_9PLEO|nr:hypothetical protein K458DRAFT_406182 [Lentithecium fluviatile CBS 122367]